MDKFCEIPLARTDLPYIPLRETFVDNLESKTDALRFDSNFSIYRMANTIKLHEAYVHSLFCSHFGFYSGDSLNSAVQEIGKRIQ